MADCSPMSRALTEVAMNLGSRPEYKTLDDVLAQMQKDYPTLDRELLVDSIIEATSVGKRVQDPLSKKLGALKREARSDKELRKRIAELEGYIARGELPAGREKPPSPGEVVAELRAIRDDANKRLRKSVPAQRQRLLGQISELTDRLEGGILLPEEKVETVAPKELHELLYQRDKLRRQVRNRIETLRGKSGAYWISAPNNFMRAIKSSWDVSAPLRQGGIAVVAHPIKGIRAMGPMFRALVSDKQRHKIEQWMESHPLRHFADKSGLELTSIDSTKITAREEMFQSLLAERIPGVKASERAYVTFLNVMRFTTFVGMVETMAKREGEPTLKEGRALATHVNIVTGRGDLSGLKSPEARAKAEAALLASSAFMWAPRYLLSRIQFITGASMRSGNNTARTRKLIAKEYARYFAGMAILYGTLAMMKEAFDLDDDELKIGMDPYSTEFGKIKVGDRRYDPLSGLSQVTVWLSRTAGGRYTTAKGETHKLSEAEFGQMGWVDVQARFARSKLSPFAGTIVNQMTGSNYIGEDYDLREMGPGDLAEEFLPLAMNEVFEVMTNDEHGVGHNTAASLLVLFGMGVQDYEERAKDPKKKKRPTPIPR